MQIVPEVKDKSMDEEEYTNSDDNPLKWKVTK